MWIWLWASLGENSSRISTQPLANSIWLHSSSVFANTTFASSSDLSFASAHASDQWIAKA
eukprot:2257784-Heterocapsa_arctica.AAC.1